MAKSDKTPGPSGPTNPEPIAVAVGSGASGADDRVERVIDATVDSYRQTSVVVAERPSNGHGPDPALPLQIPRRVVWVDLPPEYPGFKMRVWANMPQKLWSAVFSGTPEERLDALKRIVLEHNGWRDDAGDLLPQPSDDAFWDTVPNELVGTVVTLMHGEQFRLPNSLAPTNRRSGNT